MKTQSLLSLLLVLFISSLTAQTTIYTNDMDYVLGDVKQAFINNRIKTTEQADNLIRGMKNLGVNGIRIPIYTEGLNPNKPMFDYFYEQAVANGFPIFANPAQSSGGHRIANGILNGTTSSVLNDPEATNRLINRIKDFANEYTCKWINPFNEDGRPDAAWSTNQMNTIYASLFNNVNGAELIGPCVWGIPASIDVLNNTQISQYITVAATHNLGFNHNSWPTFISSATSKQLPVWDSEVNHNDAKGNGTRLEKALENNVDGLVMYNIWNTVNLTNGSINNAGKEMMAFYMKSIPAISPFVKINNGGWNKKTSITTNEGSTINIGPLPFGGTYSWYGPNGFTASTRQIDFTNSTTDLTGSYVFTFTDNNGYVNHQIFNLTISPITSIGTNISMQSLNMPSVIGHGTLFKPMNNTDNEYIYSIDIFDVNGHVIFSSESLENSWTPSSNHTDQLYIYNIKHNTTGELIKGKVFVN